MRFAIEHDIKGRMRIHIKCPAMTYHEADLIETYLLHQHFVTSVKVISNTRDVTLCYEGDRREVIRTLSAFEYEDAGIYEKEIMHSGREISETYKERLVTKTILHFGNRFLIPIPIRRIISFFKAIHFVTLGIKCLLRRKIEVPVLDATAISVAMLRGDINTAGSVMFLLGIGEILEEWTHKKSVDDLARSMSLNIANVWQVTEDNEVLVPVDQINEGDNVRVHMGNVVPFDGVVVLGEAMVNQASLTGEAIPVQKNEGKYVYAGTVLEEGELVIKVKKTGGSSRFERIVEMIEESEKLKSSVESKAEHIADSLVPYTLFGTLLTYLITRNTTKALSVLMVDFSCALKLAMPITVLSAIREASTHKMTVKGGKFLEALAGADTIVFDKTGTLTKTQPTLVDVISFDGREPDELLRIAACLEEHFPHSMAKAVVDAALKKGLEHEEMHSKVEYIVAHGIATTIEGKRAVIGSYHFVFEDEQCIVPEGKEHLLNELKGEYSYLYMAIDNRLAAVLCIEDPMREEAADVVEALRAAGVSKIVMMTGDSDKTAKMIAEKAGVDEYYSEVLPEDKARFVEEEKKAGRKVIMIGDGINDSPALSAADVGIAINDGAEIAREIADVTIGAANLHELVTLKYISDALMKRIHSNYRQIIAINGSLILLGVLGGVQPTTSALIHNTSTILISLRGMRNFLE